MNYLSPWLLVLLSSGLVFVIVASQEIPNGDDEDIVIKRGWKDVGASWGKRAWGDMQEPWGKRGWDKLNGAWGKRMTTDGPDSNDFWELIDKRPEWGKFKGSWGKRAGTGWNNLKGLWGKRSWGKMNNSWGKRSSEMGE